MKSTEIDIKDIFFMSYIGSQELEHMKQQLSRGETPTIGLSAKHDSKYLPDNITIFEVMEITLPLDLSSNQNLLNHHRIKVTKGDAVGVIVVDFPEHKLSIEESNDQFDILILQSVTWIT